MFRILLVLLLPLLPLLAVPQLSALEVTLQNNAASLRCGDLLEWQLPLDFDNLQKPPINDVQYTPYMVISDNGGNKRTRRSFLNATFKKSGNSDESGLDQDGSFYYSIRHCCESIGTHNWQLFHPNNTLLAQGNFRIQDAIVDRGFVERSKINQQLLSFRPMPIDNKQAGRGKVFIPIGLNIAWGTPPYRLEQQLDYIQKFAKNGGNHIRLWMCSWSAGIESDQADQYRLDHGALLDRLLTACRTHNIYVSLVLDNHHDLVHGKKFPYGATTVERITNFLQVPLSDQYKRRLRYIVARYGADQQIMNWELFNELDEALFDHAPPDKMGNLHQICKQWVNASASFISSIDADQHLLSSSLSWSSWDDVMAAEELDLVQVHSYIPEFRHLHQLQKDGILPLQAHISRLNGFARPYCFSELGYHGSNEKNDGNEADPQGLLLRQQAWAGFLLGGYGSGMTWWWDTYIDTNKLWPIYQPLSKAVAMINWQDPELKSIQVNQGSSLRVSGWQSSEQALLWPQLRANSWHSLTVSNNNPKYFENQHLVIKPLRKNSIFNVSWMSQIDGHIIKKQQLQSNHDGQIIIACPRGKYQAVIVIRRQHE
ncbi:MAG: cellulase family glycosylhydrolase [Planctomycetes bacterium]|nr:cellulase family glycosylhydrolase [Planctomycetota bacterium]